MSHTKGLLAVNGHMVESKDDHGWIITGCDGPDAQANARRLVACWNACDGIETDSLERGLSGHPQPMLNLAKRNQSLLEERDELVKALRKVAEWNQKYPPCRIFSHTEIVRIAAEMTDINREAEAILARYQEGK